MVDIQGLSTFVKYGSEILMGFMPRKLCDLAVKANKSLSEMPIKLIASPKYSNELKASVIETFNQLSDDLIKAHKDFRKREYRMEKDKVIFGSITEQKQIEFDLAKRLYEKLLSVATLLAECLNEKIPILEVIPGILFINNNNI